MDTIPISLSCTKCGEKVTQLPADTDTTQDIPCPVCGSALEVDAESRAKLTEIAKAEALKAFSRVPGFKSK